MNFRVLIAITFIFQSFISFSQAHDVRMFIDDTLIVKLVDNRIESIELNIKVENNTDSSILLNQQKGIVEIGSLTGEYISNHCESINYKGTYRVFMFKYNNESLLSTPVLSVGDYVYFTQSGKLKYVFLEGVDNPNKIKREFNKEKKLRSKPHSINLAAGEYLAYKAKVYLGNFELDKNQKYYLVIVYNNQSISSLSNICLESNRLTLITR